MATELTVEAVRDFIVLNDGKVKNNVLVTHFRKFLNDPSRKLEARQTFKDCVNTVAVVKTENGEKYVQLKKKYRSALPIKIPDSPPEPENDSSQTSPTQHFMVSSFDVPLSTDTEERRFSGVSSSSESASHPPTPPHPVQAEDRKKTESVPSQVDPTVTVPAEQKRRHKKSSTESTPTHRPPLGPQMDSSGNFKVPLPPGAERRSGSDITPKRTSNTGSSGSMEYRSSQTGSLGSLGSISLEQGRSNFGGSNDDSLSIMQSEASLDSQQNNDFDDERGGNNFAMDPVEKQWMLTCAKGNMLELRKMLNNDPNLVEKRDFVFGYTALHWAAKKGNEDLVRMFADTGVEVNVMSNGGYTPLHLAAMHGHEKIVQILMEEYDADARIRNYSGKLPKDYLKTSISLPMQTLLFGNDGTATLRDFAAGLRPRLDTVRKSKRLGNAISGGVGVLGAIVRGKAVSNEDVSSISSSSPHVTRKGSFSSKGKKKKNRKMSKDERSTLSLMSTPDDFEYGFGPRASANYNDTVRRGNAPSPVSKHRNRGDSVVSRGTFYGDDNGGFK